MRELEAHALEGYPSEVFGFLLGADGEVRRVQGVRRGANLLADTTSVRYQMDPRDYLRVDQEARKTGLEILGFYHSHPDHPAIPSVHDADKAWHWYTYLILATTSGGVRGIRAWRKEGEGMEEEPMKFTESDMVSGVEHD